MILNSINIFISQPLFFANPHTQCNAYQIDVKIAEFQQFFLRGDWTFVEYSKKLAYGMMSGSVASNLVDLWWQESKNFLYVPSADQINVKIVEFQQFFLRGGDWTFLDFPKNNPWEWCQKAWRQIWLTYDDRKVRIYCTKCGPNKRQNCRISTVFSEGGGLDFSGLFRKTTLGNDVRKLDAKFGWPTMTGK